MIDLLPFKTVQDVLLKNPSLIHSEELTFFKDFLKSFMIPDAENSDDEEAPPVFQVVDLQELFDEAMKVRTTNMNTFIDNMKTVLQSEDYKSARNYSLLAEAYVAKSMPELAKKNCEIALKFNPSHAKALRIRGKIFADEEEWSLALKDLSDAQSVDYDEEIAAIHKKVIQHSSSFGEKKHDENEKVVLNEETNLPRVPDAGIPSGLPNLPPDIMEGVNNLMNNPQAMEQIKNLANSFMPNH